MYVLLAPLILVLAIIFWLRPPKGRNRFYGYRTKRSMQSEEAWRLANRYSTGWFLVYAILLNVIQLICFITWDTMTAVIVTLVMMVGGLPLLFIMVERKLKERGFE